MRTLADFRPYQSAALAFGQERRRWYFAAKAGAGKTGVALALIEHVLTDSFETSAICEAYESGVGHGLEYDTMPKIEYAEQGCDYAYGLGYTLGKQRKRVQELLDAFNDPTKPEISGCGETWSQK